MSNSEIQATK